MKKKIDVALNNEDFEVLISQFHFSNEDRHNLSIMYETLLTLVDAVIIYDNAKGAIETVKYEDFFVALVSLGSGVDELIELYLSHEKVYEAYMADCIGLKLLSKAYEKLVYEVQNISNKQVEKLDFPGDTYPNEILADIVDFLHTDEVKITSNYMLSPLKSAGIILPLKEKSAAGGDIKKICNSCENCLNKNCALRLKRINDDYSKPKAYNYGYTRIFGKKIMDNADALKEKG